MPDQTYQFEPDGSIKITVDGKSVKYVKESDLLTVKGASEQSRNDYENQLAKHQADLAEANRLHDETKQTLLQERAAKEQLEAKAQEAATLTTKVGELEGQLNAAKTSGEELTNELLGIKRTTFVEQFKVDPEKVKEMDLNQLRDAEKHFTLVGFSPAPSQPARYDGGTGGVGGDGAKLSPHEQAKIEIQLAREGKAKGSLTAQ